MRQFLIGTLFGATVASISFWIATDSKSEKIAGTQSAVASSVAITRPVANTEPVEHGGIVQPLPGPLKASAPGSGISTPPLPAVAVARSNSQQSVPPVSLSADHEKILASENAVGRPPTVTELHEQFATEAKDPNWSLEMEQNLNQLIAKNNSSGEFEVLGVECRATLCEIRAFGNLPASSQVWNQVGVEMSKQPWWSNFQGNSTSSSGQNGRTTIVTILQRTKNRN